MTNSILKAVLLGATSLSAFAFGASGASAQTAVAATPTAEGTPATDDSQVIIVTGSRINSNLPTTVAPVQVVNEARIQESGTINIQDVLLENPVFGTPSFSRTANVFSTSGAGLATVDLRNLGVDRTLVLVNGRRVVSGVPGANAVDLNMIPTQMVERVEVLTSGSASAVYGSDAVAGVVNFILKDHFQGIEGNIQSGIAQAGDNFSFDSGILMGGNFADDRGNVTIFAGYSQQNAVFEKDHFTEAGRSDTDGLSDVFYGGDIFDRNQPRYSSYAPQGAFYTDNFAFTYSPTGQLQPCFTSSATSCPGGVGPNGFNRTAYRYLAIPIQRYLANFNAHYDITDGVTAFVEGSFESVHSKANIEPFPFDTLNFGKVYADGQQPIETLYNGVVYRNPYVPDDIYNDASDINGDGLKDIYVTKRLADFGPRTYTSVQNTFRLVGGLRGEFAPDWNYEVFGNYGESDVNQNGTGQINVPNYISSQEIVPDGIGGYMCANANARSQGCVPANIFGLNSFSPAAVNYLQAPIDYQAYNKETQVGANITGSLANPLGADKIGVTIGTEYRREAQDARFDVLTQEGLNGSNQILPSRGKFDLYEFYGEALLPLISHGFIEDFSIRGAARYSHYSTVGNTFSYNFGGEIAPIKDIRFRGMYAQTVRAPNVSELFAGASQNFPTVSDPCEGIEATGGGDLGDRCRAAPGVLDNIAANGSFLVTSNDRQGVTSFSSGNSGLSEEKGKTLTFGAVINPQSIHALRELTLTVDYFRVKIKDAIETPDEQFIVDQCYTAGNTGLCNLITRKAVAQGAVDAGSLYIINVLPQNSGGIKTSGIDAVLDYSHAFNMGSQRLRTSLNVAYTHLLSGYTIPDVSVPSKNYFVGETGAAKDRFTATASIGTSSVKLTATTTYIGPSYIDDQFAGYHAYKVHSEAYLDAQLRFFIEHGLEFYLGADNITNNVPVYFSGVNGAVTGEQSDTGTYDPFGRRFYAGARVKF